MLRSTSARNSWKDCLRIVFLEPSLLWQSVDQLRASPRSRRPCGREHVEQHAVRHFEAGFEWLGGSSFAGG